MIGCTILRAISGILRTHRGRPQRRRGGLGRQLAVATCAGPVRRSRAGYRLLWPWQLHSSPVWLTSSPVWLASLSPGRRRAVPTSHWPWVSSRAARRRAGSPGPYRHCRLCQRAVGLALAGTVAGGSPTAPCTLRIWRQWRRPWLVRVQLGRHCVADRQRRAASLVSGIPD
jgi:hypothetical protein